MQEKEVAVSAGSSCDLLDSRKLDARGQDKAEMITVKVNLMRGHVGSSRKFLMVVRVPRCTKNKHKPLVSAETWKEQAKLGILGSQLQRVLGGILLRHDC